MTRQPAVFDFDAPVGFTDALRLARAALDDECLTILAGNTTGNRPIMVRMRDEAGRLIDRLIVPGSRIIERSFPRD